MHPAMPLPKYHQVYLLLREQLHEGRFERGLPSELVLMKEFGVARVTMRRALERLVADGLITRTPGRGSAPVRPDAAAREAAHAAVAATADRSAGSGGATAKLRPQLGGLLGNIVRMGLRTTVKVLDCEVVPAGQAAAAALRIAPGTPVQKAVRLRSNPDGPVSHITTHVPQTVAAGFGRRELAKKPMLLLIEEAGVAVGRASQTISARLADARTARLLEVEIGSALLAVTRLVLDVDERPIEWLHGLYRPDRYEYEMQLSRVGEMDAKVWVSNELTAQFH